ncbi:hypothetical protein G7054_g5439 [Neopestalotiopsis clavispora]|nr:hypothetical protein G7054_g5439 [Neopestalotiopsis clavispora]
MPFENRAAYLVDKHGKPLEVRPAPYTAPGPGELVIRNAAVAINPLDVGTQMAGSLMFPWIKYPAIMGLDVSGVVVEVGPVGDKQLSSGQAPKFRIGDRVVGHAIGVDKRSNRACETAFQKYTVLRSYLTSKIPKDLSHERACVLPLGLSTAACGLFIKEYLALQMPKVSSRAQMEADASSAEGADKEVVVIWGGSTSVGSNAIQLARAAGYDVVATASPNNFEYVKSLGASLVLDYKRGADTVSDIIGALQSRTCAGAMAIGVGSLEACIDIVASVPGRSFVSQASNPLDMSDMPTGVAGLVGTLLKLLWWNISTALKAKMKGVSTKFIWGSDVINDQVGSAIYNDFLPEALASDRLKAKPDPRVVECGLESIQQAIDTCKTGVSAAKVVVNL